YKALGDQEAVERLNKMHKNLSDEENDFYTSVGVDALLLAAQNDALATRALDRLEEGAYIDRVIESLVPDAIEISSWPNYDPCQN
ncbi:MAG: hypothetical protein D6694_01835, partial [Gammaproteobacteria bacterium]